MDLIVGEALELPQAVETMAARIHTTHMAVADTMTTTAVEEEATEVAETAAMETAVVAATAVVATEAAAEAVVEEEAAVAVEEAMAEEGSTKCDFNSPARFIYLSQHIYSLNFPAVEKPSSLVSYFHSFIRNKTQTIICPLT